MYTHEWLIRILILSKQKFMDEYFSCWMTILCISKFHISRDGLVSLTLTRRVIVKTCPLYIGSSQFEFTALIQGCTLDYLVI